MDGWTGLVAGITLNRYESGPSRAFFGGQELYIEPDHKR